MDAEMVNAIVEISEYEKNLILYFIELIIFHML